MFDKKDGKYFEEVNIRCYEVDGQFRLKPSAFMDMAQEMAYWAAGDLGFGYDDLRKSDYVWVLSRMHFRFLKAPRWHDDAVLSTWHKGLEGLFFLRDFQLTDRQGNPFINATSSWIVIDTGSRHIVRSENVKEAFNMSVANAGSAIDEPCGKLVMPRGADPQKAGEHRVSYSDLDFIGHTNNARYMVWAMDCVDYEDSSRLEVGDVEINFNHETRHGDVVELYRLREETPEGPVYTIEGRTEGKTSFCTRISFKREGDV